MTSKRDSSEGYLVKFSLETASNNKYQQRLQHSVVDHIYTKKPTSRAELILWFLALGKVRCCSYLRDLMLISDDEARCPFLIFEFENIKWWIIFNPTYNLEKSQVKIMGVNSLLRHLGVLIDKNSNYPTDDLDMCASFRLRSLAQHFMVFNFFSFRSFVLIPAQF